MATYHVRNRVPIEDLRRGRKAAARQEDVILKFFEEHPNQGHTPFAVLAGTGLNCPITSVRRAMTDLTNANKLVKETNNQRLEIFGVRNCVWRLLKKPAQLELIEGAEHQE
jgi:hypothetical protein